MGKERERQMSAIIIDGRDIARQMRIAVKRRVIALKERGINPALHVILAGDDPGSNIYVRNKQRDCEKCGIISSVARMPETTSQEELEREIIRANADPGIHGLLIQSPLPPHLDEARALALVDSKKDVDGFHIENAGALLLGIEAPAAGTPRGCIEMLKRSGVPLEGARAVVIGRSNIVGKPMALMLLKENCTVTICHSRTKDLKSLVRQADIVVAAMRKPLFVTADMIKPGAAVIDVGINRASDNKVVGDVYFESVKEVAGWITPVPGGVGPVTIAILMQSTLEAAEKHAR
jgi:methylenetetrahydrofolate dehydrogenase (NADP+)/methenyltetrahydrofolate cyclohydrolase